MAKSHHSPSLSKLSQLKQKLFLKESVQEDNSFDSDNFDSMASVCEEQCEDDQENMKLHTLKSPGFSKKLQDSKNFGGGGIDCLFDGQRSMTSPCNNLSNVLIEDGFIKTSIFTKSRQNLLESDFTSTDYCGDGIKIND